MKAVSHRQFRWTYLFCMVLAIACFSYWAFYRTTGSVLETAMQVAVTTMIAMLLLKGAGIAIAVEAGRRGKLTAFGVMRRILMKA